MAQSIHHEAHCCHHQCTGRDEKTFPHIDCLPIYSILFQDSGNQQNTDSKESTADDAQTVMYLPEGALLSSVFQLSVSFQTNEGFALNKRPIAQRMIPEICSCDMQALLHQMVVKADTSR